jgi:hypothetical protein
VSRINVVVATTSPDVKAEVIAEAVAARPDMNLLERRWVAAAEVDALLASIPEFPQCALVIVGHRPETHELAQQWLAARADIVVMHVDVIGDDVRIAVRAARLNPLLTALRELVERVAAQGTGAVAAPRPRPLLEASIDWVHALLRDAVESVSDDNGDVHGLSLTQATLLQSLDAPSERGTADADAALDRALAAADPKEEPLAAAARVFDLTSLEFRMLVLALAPELDLRFQRCMGFLLDELGRRVGTLGLYSALLGATARVRVELAEGGALARWLVFDGQPAGDEPLRLDPFFARWLLGDGIALASEPRLRRVLRLIPWPGAALLQRREERTRAAGLMQTARWIVLGDDPAEWRALFELGARDRQPIRVELARLAGADILDVEDCARRIARAARLTGEPLIIDATGEGDDHCQRLLFATLDGMQCRAAVICRDALRVVKLLGPIAHEWMDEPALPPAARVDAIRAAGAGAGEELTEAAAEVIANRYPLSVEGLEHAMRLARGRSSDFTAACRQVAGEGLSHLAERIEPVFTLDEVVLPPDRKQQLTEIVDHVRLAPRVLDEWKFREQLPYGRGVAALFHGPSGTGKTMAALAVARRLGILILRLDFSKVVSKYIGDTEKNIDLVFTDAQRSGSAILIDEADALMGKRSEVKDAHDRYANIEVAYLLQRMEA